jgi:alkylation response protein AidB-like acyl-CoA dehydrogenase
MLHEAPQSHTVLLDEALRSSADHIATLLQISGMSDHLSMDLTTEILEQAHRFASEQLAPLRCSGDEAGCRLDAHGVKTPPGWPQAYRELVDGEWLALGFPEVIGGQGLPWPLACAVHELLAKANMAFALSGILTNGACHLLQAFGSPEVKDYYLPHLVTGRWAGTMCLTEPQAGSDLRLVRAVAKQDERGSWRLSGTKIFISYGEHDLADNIAHLVLARAQGAAEGLAGLGVYLVPRFLDRDQGALQQGRDPAAGRTANGVRCTRLENKMGLHGSPTCELVFEEAWCIPLTKPGEGLAVMFSMMNLERLLVAVQALGVAQGAMERAWEYALMRCQGRSSATATGSGSGAEPILLHADVQRMLRHMEILVGGCRMLLLQAAWALEVAEHAPDETARHKARAHFELLVPISKAFVTDAAIEVADTAIQVWGGHGYIRDNGIEQYLRDVRVTAIYEGTNGIQAMDLVRRKIARDQGALVHALLENVARSAVPMAEAAKGLQKGVTVLREWVTSMCDALGKGQVFVVEYCATDLLRALGILLLCDGWISLVARAKSGSMSTRLRLLSDEAQASWIPQIVASHERFRCLLAQSSL